MNIKQFLVVIGISFTFMIGAANEAKASHALGADLTYDCVGQDSFLVSYAFYRDCIGINAPAAESVTVSSVACNATFNVPLVLQNPGGTLDTNYVCVGTPTNCDNGNVSAVAVYFYEALVVLPDTCNDWIMGVGVNARNAAITNLVNPGSEDLYVEATLDNTGSGVCNSSPFFTSSAAINGCVGLPFTYNHGAVDPDGDSLVFTSIIPLDASGSPITTTGTYPVATTAGGPYMVDPITGQISFTASQAQVVALAVLVEEFRNGVLVGSTIRDVQIRIDNCTGQPATGPIVSATNASIINENTIDACPDLPISFTFTIFNPAGDDIYFASSNIQVSIPGANLSVTRVSSDTLSGLFTWTPTVLDTGANVFTVNIKDEVCPYPFNTYLSYNVNILDGTFAGPDEFYCISGDSIQLLARGGSMFTWTPSFGLSDTTVANPLAGPPVTTTYVVTSDLATTCRNMDTITVFVVPDFIFNITPDNDTLDFCRNEAVQLNVETDSTFAPYDYLWNNASTLNSDSIQSPIARPFSSTQYIVTVTSDTGCTLRDTLELNTIGVGPLVIVTTDNNEPCPGDTVNLQADVFPLTCGPALVPCNAQNPPSPKTLGTSTTATFQTPFEGNALAGKYQALYLASDLAATGVNPGTISRIAYEVGTKTSNGVYENFTISLGCTDVNALSLNEGWLPAPTQVFFQAGTFINQGYNNFNFQQQYDWDGISNIVVEICWTAAPGALGPGGNDQTNNNATTYVASMRSPAATAGNGCSLDPSFTYQFIPNTRFFTCDADIPNYTFQWNPASSVSNDTIPNPSAVITEGITFIVEVEDTQCVGSGLLTIPIDTTFDIAVTPDTQVCSFNDTLQLLVEPTGNFPTSILACGPSAQSCPAPAILQVGNGTTTLDNGDGTPFNQFWEDSHVQYLIRAADLQAAGLSSGTLSNIAFNVLQKNSSAPYSSFTVSVGCTGDNALPNNNFNITSPLTTVYSGSFTSAQGWNTINFQNFVDWDGTSNLIVEVCHGVFDWTDDDAVQGRNVNYNAVTWADQDAQGAIACNSVSFPATAQNLPNFRFGFCPAPVGTETITWSPNESISDTTIADPRVYPTNTTTYTVTYEFVNGCTRTDSVTITVTPLQATAGPDTAICVGDTVQLFATGASNYEWAANSSISDVTINNPLAYPLSTTDYIVTVTERATGCQGVDTASVVVNLPPVVDFGFDSLLCFVDSLVINAGAGYVSYDWSTGETTQTISTDTTGLFYVEIVDTNGCVNSDTVRVRQNASPVVSLGNDTTLCVGDLLTLAVDDVYATYIWSIGVLGDTSIVVDTAGDYWVRVTDSIGCPTRDTINVMFNVVEVDFGPDQFYCFEIPDTTILIAGPASWNYVWQDGSTDSFLIVTDTLVASVTATDAAGCSDVDTIEIGIYPIIPLDLGRDTFLCPGGFYNLSAPGFVTWNWSTGSTGFFTGGADPDTIWVVTTDINGCVYTDTIRYEDGSPNLDLGGDTAFCVGGIVTLDAGPGLASYDWAPNGETTQTIDVDVDGTYGVTVVDAVTGCSAEDEVMVNVAPLPTPNLGLNQTVCLGDSTTLALQTGYNGYDWSTGETTATIEVGPGTYEVTVTTNFGCTGTDDITVGTYAVTPFSMPDLPRCLLSDVVTAAVDTSLFSSPVWSTGETTPSIDINTDGNYCVTVSDSNGCEVEACFDVVIIGLDVLATANPDTINRGESTILSSNYNDSINYTFDWTPVMDLNGATLPSPEATPEEDAWYEVTVINSLTGCSGSDSVLVIVNSENEMPTAFSPNGDGMNDDFYYVGNANVLLFQVFNRWGELIHNDPSTPWDGKLDGTRQPVGTYVYVIEYEIDGEQFSESKPFSLYR